MKTTTVLVALLAVSALAVEAAQLTESTFTEIIHDVNVLPANGPAGAPAQVNQLVRAPDRVRTGADSRAEMTAPDHTITRIGANTVFSFDTKDRVLNLERGSLLFHSRQGAGGGRIKSGGASAAVLGTTIIVAANAEGGFKVIVLEGRGRVTLPNGRSVSLRAGQMVYVLANGKGFSGVLQVNLAKLVAGSLLLTGFSHELPSWALIQAAVQSQASRLADGSLIDTGISADNFAHRPKIGNGLSVLDENTYRTLVLPFARGQ